MELIGLHCYITQDVSYSARRPAAGGSVFVLMLAAISLPSERLLGLLIKSAEQQN